MLFFSILPGLSLLSAEVVKIDTHNCGVKSKDAKDRVILPV